MDPLVVGSSGRAVDGLPSVEHPLSPPLSLTRSSRKQSRTIPNARAGQGRADDTSESWFPIFANQGLLELMWAGWELGGCEEMMG
jgi:hypothetical protein